MTEKALARADLPAQNGQHGQPHYLVRVLYLSQHPAFLRWDSDRWGYVSTTDRSAATLLQPVALGERAVA